jgi:general secretion pathway protein K
MAFTFLVKSNRTAGERGFILFVVLIFAALLASVLAGVLRTSLSYVYASAAYSDAVRADELGRSAANLVAQRVLLSDPDAKRGGAFVVRLPDADIFVSYLSEAARVDVNATQPELLVALFKDAGVNSDAANALGARINSWLAQTGAQSNPLNQGQNTAPSSPQPLGMLGGGAMPTPEQGKAQIHLEDVSEIVTAWGMPGDMFNKVQSYLTVSNPTGKIDPVLASPLIIRAIFQGDDQAADSYLRKRARGFATESDALMSIPLGARGYVGFSPSIAFRAWVRVQLHNRVARQYEMVVVPPRKLGDAVRVTDWEAL